MVLDHISMPFLGRYTMYGIEAEHRWLIFQRGLRRFTCINDCIPIEHATVHATPFLSLSIYLSLCPSPIGLGYDNITCLTTCVHRPAVYFHFCRAKEEKDKELKRKKRRKARRESLKGVADSVDRLFDCVIALVPRLHFYGPSLVKRGPILRFPVLQQPLHLQTLTADTFSSSLESRVLFLAVVLAIVSCVWYREETVSRYGC